ncbi:MAG TPA: nickel-dependent lactate racemase [Thermoanaerobaculia bacterium]|nr:nickel-dependent lactate racemase [Thermoanaerobaculia bacterium]
MKPEIEAAVRGADLGTWKSVEVEYGAKSFPVLVPEATRILEMNEVAPLLDPGARMRASLNAPIGSRTLPAILLSKGKPAAEVTVCITTSDITRPVPYKGDSGILPPLLAILHEAGVRRENVTLIVGTGTHRPSSAAEKVTMFGEDVVAQYRIVDHVCDDAAALVGIGRTASGTEIQINRTFYEADVKIATALVESHFMAGASGGRKAVCPALVSRRTIERFHSAQFLDSPLATNLVLEGNPCHEEALEIAKRCGVDFIVNTVLNRRLQLLEVFAGDLVLAHAKAVELLRNVVAIPVDEEYDVVLTHGGYVGINHYQIAKAAVNALPVVRPGGTIILAACERDDDAIGPLTYRTLLHLLKLQGPGGYMSALLNPGWTFTKDQWEPQMWAKVLEKVGEEGLVYCSAVLSPKEHLIVPGRAGWDYLPADSPEDEMAKARTMVQNAIVHAVQSSRSKGAAPRVAFIKEGPYAVPVRKPAADDYAGKSAASRSSSSQRA